MDFLMLVKALVLGVVEGVTEFLPVSSTGHLIVAADLMDYDGPGATVFMIVIQFGAILAVCWEYRHRLAGVIGGLGSQPLARRFALNVVIATVPAVIVGLMFGKQIKAALYSPVPVAVALIVGGMVILWAEARQPGRDAQLRVTTMDELMPLDALKVGIAQCFALIPGTSRSGATIIGGMLFGLERRVATEFSFFLAIPIMFGATVYELYKARADLRAGDLELLLVGSIAAFISAFICVRWLLRYLASHDFTVFAWYRIAFGMAILVTAYGGWVSW
jgi:undecaprenyl-diphosphatase